MVRLRGLKWCPVSRSDVLTDPFQTGRLPRVEPGRAGVFALAAGAAARELANVDSLGLAFLFDWADGAGKDECLLPVV